MIRYSLSVLFFVVIHAQAQDIYTPEWVARAAFFDKTPPLRDMPVVLPGQLETGWKDGIILNESLGYKPGDTSLETDAATLQEYFGKDEVKGPIVNVGGTGNVNGVFPPDTDGDVGPDHYFQMINLSFAIYDKQGTKLYGPVANSTLWSGFPGPWSGTNDGDPIILYDELADRWVASQFAIYTSNSKYYELVAVSETGDPLGAWYRYAFEFNLFPDYPKLAVWPDGYYATFHMFSGSYAGMGVAVFERDKMLTGDPDAQMIYFGQYSSKFGFLPSDVDGDPPPSGTPNFITGINMFGNHNMEVWELQADWVNPGSSTFTLAQTLTPAGFNPNVNGITQPGTGTQLDALSQVLMFRLPYRNFGTHEAMVANHTIWTGGRAAIRWYELRDEGAGWYIYQQGTYAPDNENRWMGSIAMSGNGSIALGFSVSGSTTYPSLRYTGRTPDAPAGEMNIDEVEIIAGASSQTGIERWGDYSCMSVDPVNDTTFWFTSEYMKSSGWGTRICAFDFGEILAPTAWAGADTTICEDELFSTAGEALYYASVLWETSGDGIFQNASTMNAKYLRGQQDILSGSVTLTLTAYGYNSGQMASDDMVLSIRRAPSVFAGNDTTIHYNQSLQLNGEAMFYSSLIWTSAGDGFFSDPTTLNPVYTPGPGDIAAGEVMLTLKAFPEAPCEDADSDVMKLLLDPTTGAGEQFTSERGLSVIPNPTDGRIDVVLADSYDPEGLVVVRDMLGAEVARLEMAHTGGRLSAHINLAGNPGGVYLLEILNGDQRLIRKVILK
ncbi:MAG: T9SS type A sorting domain-containing protein [Bacteroidales bacterium]|nr:T9SS type A sorting domain-containing protein [Bacteroidales bacterium]